MSTDREKIQKELAKLERDGLIKPSDVVAFAASPKTSLHACFTWDDTEAAKQWRLEQARGLIRCYVVVADAPDSGPVRAFVSLRSDRKTEGGGYRRIVDVMSNEQLHAQLMRDALTDLRAAQKRYAQLQELAGVFEAVDRVSAEFEQKQTEAA